MQQTVMALQQFNEYSQRSYSVQVAHRLRVEHISGNFTPHSANNRDQLLAAMLKNTAMLLQLRSSKETLNL